jgi:hypothetical protein
MGGGRLMLSERGCHRGSGPLPTIFEFENIRNILTKNKWVPYTQAILVNEKSRMQVDLTFQLDETSPVQTLPPYSKILSIVVRSL